MNRLEEFLETVRFEYETMELNPDSAQGKLKDYYYEKEEINREQEWSRLSTQVEDYLVIG